MSKHNIKRVKYSDGMNTNGTCIPIIIIREIALKYSLCCKSDYQTLMSLRRSCKAFRILIDQVITELESCYSLSTLATNSRLDFEFPKRLEGVYPGNTIY